MRVFLKGLLTVCIALLVAAILVEVLLRFMVPKPFLGYGYDPNSGTRLIPGAEGWWTLEGRNYIRVNNAGANDDRDYQLAKGSKTLRVAVLGDSYVEALQVAPQEAFWRRAEQELVDRCAITGNDSFEVLQFGVSGHGAPQYLQTWDSRVSQFRPDLVVTLITTGNDFRNAEEALEGDTGRPYLVKGSDGYEWDMSFQRESPLNPELGPWARVRPWVLENLRTVAVAWESLRRVRDSRAADPADDPLSDVGDNAIYTPFDELSPDWQAGFLATAEALSLLDTSTTERGSEFLVAIGSNGPQVTPSERNRRELAESLGVKDLDGPNEWLAERLLERGVNHIDLVRPLREAASASGIGLHGEGPGWDGHWNSAGHAAVASEIAPAMCRTLGGTWRDF